ncbi:phosphotransferase family protein [Vreelandella alkaliphila]|uniref:Phosphotransferase n=1 Tax=Vreelandella alkaliphila TaxID=272774 RepID=A0A7C9NX15_9GAMM|nr:phosphotransferase [Halomonas alkaliphila]NDL70371.1 phosphotransferase [Halomonas alkaliphila]
MLAEHYAAIAVNKLKEGKRKLARSYLRLACNQAAVSDYIYLLHLEAEVWDGKWAVALSHINRVQPGKLAASDQFRYYWVCARLFSALGKKRLSLTYFNMAMEMLDSVQWKYMMRDLRLALPLAGRVTKQLFFPGGFANNGCMLHVVSKKPEFITKFFKDNDNYTREAFFYGYCAAYLDSEFILTPVYFSDVNSPFMAICLPYVNRNENLLEPIESIPKADVIELIGRLANVDLDVGYLNTLRVPALPISLSRNMVNLRNVLLNTCSAKSYKYLRLMLVYSLRRIKNLRNISVASKQYALDIGFFFLKNSPLKKSSAISALDHGLCHSDLKADNIILSNDNRFFIIDWGNLSFGPLGYDIAVFVSESNLSYCEARGLLHDAFPFSEENKFFTWWACYFHCLRNLEKQQEMRFGEALLFLRNNIMSINSSFSERGSWIK